MPARQAAGIVLTSLGIRIFVFFRPAGARRCTVNLAGQNEHRPTAVGSLITLPIVKPNFILIDAAGV